MFKTQIIKRAQLSFAVIVMVFGQATSVIAAGTETLIVAGGCFWCVESDFESVDGVQAAISGYTGGSTKSPTYKQVSRGGTGHYEAVKILFDPDIVRRDQLLNKFFRSIDPTDAGGQFCDRGESYRAAVFVATAAENQTATNAVKAAQTDLGQKVVTPILKTQTFYDAEAYHQDYYKGKKIVLTRFGPKRQSEAYKRYRKACKRDERVKQLWGDSAPFVGD